MALPYADSRLLNVLAERYGVRRSELVLFYMPYGPFGFLASCQRARFSLDDQEWQSVEHYFQAAKFAAHAVLFDEVRTARDPWLAKAIAGRNRHQRLANWHQVRDQVMRRAYVARFAADRRAMRLLMATRLRPVVEVSLLDRYWGCGADGKGMNRIGEIVMSIRKSRQIG